VSWVIISRHEKNLPISEEKFKQYNEYVDRLTEISYILDNTESTDIYGNVVSSDLHHDPDNENEFEYTEEEKIFLKYIRDDANDALLYKTGITKNNASKFS